MFARKRRIPKFLLLGAMLFYFLALFLSNVATAHADTVFMVGGADVVQEPGVPRHFYMPAINNGDFCKNVDDTCTIANFSGAAGALTPSDPTPLDKSIADAVGPLADQIKNTPGKKTIVAISAGTPVAQEVANQLQNDPNGPSASELSVVVEGGIDRGIGKLVPEGTHLDSIGYTTKSYAPTKYPTTVATMQYDGMGAPTPDPMSHPLAAANNIMGAESAHVGYFTSSLDNPANQVTQVGNTTYIEMPHQGDLPLVQAMDSGGVPQIANEDQVQADIDAAGPQPLPGEQAPVNAPPQMVDQMISTAAPVFTQGINEQKDNLVNELVPILGNDPQLQQYIPPALLEDVPAAPPAEDATQMLSQDNPPVAAPDVQSAAVQDMSANADQAAPMDNVPPPADPIQDFSDIVPGLNW